MAQRKLTLKEKIQLAKQKNKTAKYTFKELNQSEEEYYGYIPTKTRFDKYMEDWGGGPELPPFFTDTEIHKIYNKALKQSLGDAKKKTLKKNIAIFNIRMSELIDNQFADRFKYYSKKKIYLIEKNKYLKNLFYQWKDTYTYENRHSLGIVNFSKELSKSYEFLKGIFDKLENEK